MSAQTNNVTAVTIRNDLTFQLNGFSYRLPRGRYFAGNLLNPFPDLVGQTLDVVHFQEEKYFVFTHPQTGTTYDWEEQLVRPDDLRFVEKTATATVDVLSIMDGALRAIAECDPIAGAARMHGLACAALDLLGKKAAAFKPGPRLPIGSLRIEDGPPARNGAAFAAAA